MLVAWLCRKHFGIGPPELGVAIPGVKLPARSGNCCSGTDISRSIWLFQEWYSCSGIRMFSWLKMVLALGEGVLSSGKKENRKEQDSGLNGAGR